MPTEERTLSRANIQRWLVQTDSKLQPKVTPAPTTCSNSTDKKLIRVQARKSRNVRHQKDPRRNSPLPRAAYDSKSFRVGQLRKEETEAGGRYQERGTTGRLRLQGPFRAVDHDVGKSHPPSRQVQKAQDRLKKNHASRTMNEVIHRHRELSISSDLKPARTIELDSVPGPEDVLESVSVTTKSCRRRSIRGTAKFSARIGSPILPFTSPKLLRPIYERQKRHRTREDRYDVNNTSKRKRQKPEEPSGDKKPAKKRKHREKSGRALMTDFTAPNVAPERLTLKSGNRIGLFNRGKASAPIRRRGVADLEFSELAFLNTSRNSPNQGTKGLDQEEARKARKARKDADREAEISQYFTANKARHQDNAGESDDRRWYQAPKLSGHIDSPSFIIESPEKAFLGFGTSGANSVSPVKIVKNLDARYVLPLSQRTTLSPTRSTSYLTWSQTTAPPVSRKQKEFSTTKMPPVESHPRVSISGSHSMLSEPAVPSDDDCAHEDQCEGLSKASSAPVPSHRSFRSVNPGLESPCGRQHLPGSPSYSNISRPKIKTLIAAENISNHTSRAHSPRPATALLPQHLVNQQVYDSIESTADALLQACKAKLSEATTAKLGHAPQSIDDRPQSKHSQNICEVKQVPYYAYPDKSTLLQTESERESRPSQQLLFSNPKRTFSRDFHTDNQHVETLAPSKNSPNLDVQPISHRPQTKNSMCPRAVCTSFPIACGKAWNDYDALYERQQDNQLHITNVSHNYADRVKNDDDARNDNEIKTDQQLHAERTNLMHSYAGSMSEIGDYDLDEGHSEDAVQVELASYQQDHRNAPFIDREAENYFPKDILRRTPVGHHIQIIDPTPHLGSFYEPKNPWMLEDARCVRLDVIDRAQSSISYAKMGEPSLATHTSPSMSAREQNTREFSSRSRGREVVDSLPAGFWRPNRLY